LGLVTEQNKLLWNNSKSSDDKNATNVCRTGLDATREAIRKNWEYLREVNLGDTHLERIQLYLADLHGASLIRATLNDANFRCANLQGADFTDSNWKDRNVNMDLKYANVRDVKPDEFKEWATTKGEATDKMDEAGWADWIRGNQECHQVLPK
jgi:uncharacterized protein YjbI with pentapeptide repeats